MRFSTEKVEASRNFANKIWNASRFVQMNLTIDKAELPETLALEDKWILSKFNDLVKAVTENIDKYELGLAVQKLYDFIWDNFCDWYIEIVKPRLQNKDDVQANENAQKVLCYVLSNTMKLLHPFMPFITETIWQALPHDGESIMVSKWPEYQDSLNFAVEAEQVETIMDTIRSIRARRAEMNVPPSKKAQVILFTENRQAYEAGSTFFAKLAYASEIQFVDAAPSNVEAMVSVVTKGAQVYMPMGELVDFEKEKARLEKEKAKVQKDIDFVMKKLNNEGFVAKAPAAVIAQEREKAAKYQELMDKLNASLAALG